MIDLAITLKTGYSGDVGIYGLKGPSRLFGDERGGGIGSLLEQLFSTGASWSGLSEMLFREGWNAVVAQLMS
jgi:hypothetical protein